MQPGGLFALVYLLLRHVVRLIAGSSNDQMNTEVELHECPSRSATTRPATPPRSRIPVWVWRRSWNAGPQDGRLPAIVNVYLLERRLTRPRHDLVQGRMTWVREHPLMRGRRGEPVHIRDVRVGYLGERDGRPLARQEQHVAAIER